jgi:hypothetical protein
LTRPSFERSLTEFYTILLEELLQVALETLEVEICSSLEPTKLTRVVKWYSNLVTGICRDDVEVHVHALQRMTEHFQLCEWGQSSWKTASLFGNNMWFMWCTWLPNLSTYSLAVIRPWRVIMGPTEQRHCCPNHHRTSPVFHCWYQAFRIAGFLGCSQNFQLFLMQGTAWRTTQLTISRALFQWSHVQVLWSWHFRLRIWALFSVISDVATVDLP